MTTTEGGGPLVDLVARWRGEAEVLARYGAGDLARLTLRLADEVETALGSTADESLTLQEAAMLSGFSTDHLRHLVAGGVLANVGRRGAPRLRRGDLPSKVRRRLSGAYSPEDDALRLTSKFAGGGS